MATSSSGSGKKSRSLRVGPAPLSVSGGPNNSVIRADMCYYCFDVLSSYLHGTEHPRNPPFPNDLYPLFVTWKIGREGHLRGCIGTFSEISLHDGLSEYAITSATRDSRFSAITVSELPRLHCSVSLLIRFEDGRDYMDWQIGHHGIRIEFMNEKGHRKTATYLPEVAAEQGWNHIQTINSLLKKGGHRGAITEELRQSIKLTRYQSEKLSVSYADYVAHTRQLLTRGSDVTINRTPSSLQENGFSYSPSSGSSFSPIPSPYLRAPPSSAAPTMHGHRHLSRNHAPYSTNRQGNNGGGAGHYSRLPFPPPPPPRS